MKFETQTRVVFHKNLKCFYDTQRKKRMKGITEILQDIFYPKFRFLKAKRPAAAKAADKKVAAKKKKSAGVEVGVGGKKKKFLRSKRFGQRRGSRVDTELAAIVNGELVANPHNYTRQALDALHQCSLRPIGAQVVVYHEAANLATGVDILCVDVDGTLAVVELKCSTDSRYDWSCGLMRGVMSGHVDSLEEQHKLQAAVTALLFKNTYPEHKVRAYVLRVNDEGAHVTKVRKGHYTEAFDHLITKSTAQLAKAAAASSARRCARKAA